VPGPRCQQWPGPRADRRDPGPAAPRIRGMNQYEVVGTSIGPRPDRVAGRFGIV
jgi:hypothetical protein